MAEIVAALPDVQIAVADTGCLDLDQDLGPRRLRRRLIHLSQGGVEIGNLETLHSVSPDSSCSCRWADIATYCHAFVRGLLRRPGFPREGCDFHFRETALPEILCRVLAQRRRALPRGDVGTRHPERQG